MSEVVKRSKGRFKSDIKNIDFYRYYKKNVKSIESLSGGKTKGSYNIKSKEYSDILKDVNSEVCKTIVNENFEFKIPCRLGLLSMRQKIVKLRLDKNGNLNTKNLSLDYKSTKELWKNDEEALKNKTLIFHTNEHTNGSRMAYWWSKKNSNVHGLMQYYFLPCRTMKRMPAKYLKNKDLRLMFFEQDIYKKK